MYCISKETELSPIILHKMISDFNVNIVPKLQKYENYYDGKQAILNKSYTDESKPCHRVVTNFCKNITDSFNGYLAAPSFISYSSDNDIEEIMDVLRYNDYQTEDSNFLFDALKYGTASELMYIDSEGKTRFKLINPTTCFGIYDNTLEGELLYFVRIYKANEWDESNEYIVDVYDDYIVKHYKMAGKDGNLEYTGEDKHYFGQCPANIFSLADEKNIFDCVISLQDAYNELTSDEIDDYSAFCDAYLTLTGCELDSEDIKSMKQNRVLLLPEGATSNWLTKQGNDVQIENMLKRIQSNIYKVAQCIDFSSETFVGGVTSGVAIRYRLTGMETRGAIIVASMKKALQRRIEIICGIATLKLGEEIYRDISITFNRNIPEDISVIINSVNALKGTVSDATLLDQIPFVTDVNAELEAVKKQREENMAMYDFGSSADEDEE